MSFKGKATADELRGKINGLETIKGYSAYEIALIHGFEGTEEEWLDSLNYVLTEADKGEIADIIVAEGTVEEEVGEWMDHHPEATTTVLDHSLTIDKMVVGTLGYVSPKMFGAVGDGVTDDTEAVRKALSSNAPKVVFDKGVYKITTSINVTSGEVKSVDGNGCTILTGSIGSSSAIVFHKAVNIDNFNFDCQNSSLNCVVSIYNDENTDEVVKIRNITIKNLRDTETTTSSTLIDVCGFIVDISECHMENCYKIINNVVGDGGGNLTGIYAHVGNNSTSGKIYNCSFKNMSNIDSAGNLAYEDVSCVYVSNMRKLADGETLPDGANVDDSGFFIADETTTSFTIENIKGINYGKRLVKVQSSNVIVRNVTAYADDEHDDSLSAVGVLGPGKNAVIDGVTVTGKCILSIAACIRETIVSNCIISTVGRIDIPGYGNLMSCVLAGSNVSIRDCIFSKSNYAVAFVDPAENITISGCTWNTDDYYLNDRVTAFIYLSNSQGAKNLKISDCKLSGYCSVLTYKASEGITRDSFIMENNTFFCKQLEGKTPARIILTSFNNVLLKDNVFFVGNDEVNGRTDSCITCTDCEWITIDGAMSHEYGTLQSNNNIVKLQNCSGNNTLKRVFGHHYNYLTYCDNVSNLDIEIVDPTKHYVLNCDNVKTNVYVVNTESELPAQTYGIAPGMTYYIIETKKFKRKDGTTFVEV